MSEERAQKRRKARKEPELVELSRLALDPQTALIIRLPAKLGGDKWLADLRAQLPDGASAWIVDAGSYVEIVQRGRKQTV